jgi:hypothetical protein
MAFQPGEWLGLTTIFCISVKMRSVFYCGGLLFDRRKGLLILPTAQHVSAYLGSTGIFKLDWINCCTFVSCRNPCWCVFHIYNSVLKQILCSFPFMRSVCCGLEYSCGDVSVAFSCVLCRCSLPCLKIRTIDPALSEFYPIHTLAHYFIYNKTSILGLLCCIFTVYSFVCVSSLLYMFIAP